MSGILAFLLYACGAVDKIMMLPHYEKAANDQGYYIPTYGKILTVVLWPLVVAYEAFTTKDSEEE